jgi:hypothetical protein
MNYTAIPFLSTPAIEAGNAGVVGSYELFEGDGCIAVNADASLISSLDNSQHCVRIYSVDGAAVSTVGPVIVGTVGVAGCADGQLSRPLYSCFAHRNGVDTLLICDCGNNRVVEVSVSGDFLRAIAVSWPLGIAYCGVGDVIAVSQYDAHAVVLLQYESGAVKPEVTIGTGTRGSGDGQLYRPNGVAFTADGRFILVADCGNHRVSKFNAANGAFIAHVATNAVHGIEYPRGIVQCEDGIILVTITQWRDGGEHGSVVCVGADDETVQNIIIYSAAGCAFFPESLSYSPSLHGVVVKTVEREGEVLLFLLRDAWMASSRRAWLCAVSTPSNANSSPNTVD